MRVFQNEYFESLWVPPAVLGYPQAPGRVRIAPWLPTGFGYGMVRLVRSG